MTTRRELAELYDFDHRSQLDQDAMAGFTWSMEKKPWHFWSQMADPAMDGDGGSGPNAPNDCGPEVDSMILKYITDVTLDADYIWDIYSQERKRHGEPAGPGYTSFTDSIRFWEGYAGAHTLFVDASTLREPTDARPSYFWHVWKALTLDHSIKALRSWSEPGSADGHFEAIIGLDPTSVITADPANGQRRVWSYDAWWSWSKGSLLIVQRRRAVSYEP
jgi:hypothetical protein